VHELGRVFQKLREEVDPRLAAVLAGFAEPQKFAP
jgi:hypothetical protein